MGKVYYITINNRPLSHYLRNLEGESFYKCWDSCVEVPEGHTHPDDIPDDAVDVLTLSNEKMQDGRYEYVISMETRVFFGNEGDCPIGKYHETANFKEMEESEDAIVLVY